MAQGTSLTERIAGVGATGGVIALAAAGATLPLILAPVLVAWLLPGAGWHGPFAWWWVPAGIALLVVASFASSVVEAVFAVMFPRPSQRWMLTVLGGLATIAALTFGYSLVLGPPVAALAAAFLAWAVVSILERVTGLLPSQDPIPHP